MGGFGYANKEPVWQRGGGGGDKGGRGWSYPVGYHILS